ncbi:gamma subclass chorismate mutase AroQ [uncultured Endozoicomonas sp.]|uniref:gamma subclass chorismate mutase AroQ n=1 Tax=uncultured Endozoicomonas sp. TaxID=432652 RepID=UPI002626D5F9|nr:gamma subclass chorismate mutase AroQ [uncultured Endozoicomonas sp.]
MFSSADKENIKPTKHQSAWLKRAMTYFLPLILVLLAATWTRADPVASGIFELINQRLAYMQYVALSKASTHSPIANYDRELKVLKKAKTEAKQLGLNAESLSFFVQAQMDVAKAIQYRYLADWQVDKPSHLTAMDLDLKIRPELLKIDKEILTKLKSYLDSGQTIDGHLQHEFFKAINIEHITDKDKAILFNSLEKVRLR